MVVIAAIAACDEDSNILLKFLMIGFKDFCLEKGSC